MNIALHLSHYTDYSGKSLLKLKSQILYLLDLDTDNIGLQLHILQHLSNRIQESGVRKQIRILYDWRMNNRIKDHQIFNLVVFNPAPV
jgi:hypothetical protein